MNPMIVSGIWIYPVKALQGVPLQQAQVERRGLRHDRRWMLVDESGVMITQRQVHELVRIMVRPKDGEWLLYHRNPASGQCSVPLEAAGGNRLTVQVWDDRVEALWPGLEADGWLSGVLNRSCRLVYMDEHALRPADERYAGPDQLVSFADAYPFLLLNQASLAELSNRSALPLEAERFRPNFLISGSTPFAEDHWRRISMDGIGFELVKPCARCVVTTLDPFTGDKSAEPLRTLATFRQWGNKLYFGYNMICLQTGQVEVGADVVVEE
jgi:uncharacterized protein